MIIKRKYMLNIIFLIVLIGGFIYFQKSIEKSESNRLKLGKYAIGSFIIFNNQLGRSYINKYEYFFYDDSGNKYYRGDSKKLPAPLDMCKRWQRLVPICNRHHLMRDF